ncbi:antibiotic biosynthesis monooxygenase [Arcobacter sp. 31_11_sub10_T18]|nr:antibiotic biosynthesis monooxygenase [Arcobacter sp. 31_11_sub10_T18]
MNTEISMMILIEVKEGRRGEQINSYKKLLPLVLAEEGCLQYDLKAVDGNSNEFILIERWASKEALLAHDNSPYMIEADKNNVSFRAKPAQVLKLLDI